MQKYSRWHHFLLKLRRRRIIETVGAFIAGGWLILEFVHWALIMHYRLPEKIFDIAFVSIVCALLCTVLWRWFHVHQARKRKFRIELVLIPVLIAAAAIVNVNFFLKMEIPEEEMAYKIAWKDSVAVMPFADLSQLKDQNAFCENLTDDIITRLSSIPGLRVIARSSSEKYKDTNKSIARIGKESKVNQILEGTLKKEGAKVRITARLIDVRRGFNFWSETYDRTTESCFEIQEEIAGDIAGHLQNTR